MMRGVPTVAATDRATELAIAAAQAASDKLADDIVAARDTRSATERMPSASARCRGITSA